MKSALQNKLQQKMANNEGFTLLEILVVLTIMGFLIAMVAPRLAGIAGDAVDTVCDSNQSRMIQNMSVWYERQSSYPNNMTNLVDEIDTDTFQIPAISDDDTANGAETFAAEFNSRNHFRIHYLDAAEINELRGLGVTKVFNLNAYDGYDDAGALKSQTIGDPDYYDNTAGVHNDVSLAANVTTAFPRMEPMPVVATDTVAVAMIGMGIDGAGAWAKEAGEADWGEDNFHGRIVLGFGPENEMVTSGLISNAAHCPGGLQNSDHITYNDYNLVLPRLSATLERFTVAEVAEFRAINYDDEGTIAAGYDVTAGTGNPDNYMLRVVELDTMEEYQYATICPEGHKFPADEGDYWGLDLDANNAIN